MKLDIEFLLFLIVFQSNYKNVQAYIAYNQYSLFKELDYMKCDCDQSTQLIYGQDIFKQSSGLDTVDRITIAGWFYFRGYNNMVYNLFEVYEGGQMLFRVGYQLNAKQISATLMSQLFQDSFNTIVKNSWYFVRSTVQYTSNQITLQTDISTESTLMFQQPQHTLPKPAAIKKSDVVVSVGNYSKDLLLNQSCSFIKYIRIYWDDPLVDPLSYYNDLLINDIHLLWHFDFFYYEFNSGYIYNMAYPMNQLAISFNTKTTFQLIIGQTFQSDYFKIDQFGGFTIVFDVKVQSIANNHIRVLSLNYASIPVYLEFHTDGCLYLNSMAVSGILHNQWNQITIIGKRKVNCEIYLIVKGFEGQVQKIIITSFALAQLEFGWINNSDAILLSNLRVYEGAFLTQQNNNNCFLQASREEVQTCIICNSPYLMDYQTTYGCVPLSSLNSNTVQNYVQDWKPQKQECYEEMIRDAATNDCVCRYQYYRFLNECVRCPSYCRGCIDRNTCIEQDTNRLYDGSCPTTMFDDGYKCLSNKLSIQSRNTFNKAIPALNIGPNCLQNIDPTPCEVRNTDLRLTNNSTFFFSFTYQQQLPNYQRGSIMYLKDGTNEMFTIMYNRTGLPLVQFFVQGKQQHEFQVNSNEPVWIALWTDLQKAVFIVHSNAQLLYKEISVSFPNFSYNDPFVCVGPCLSFFDDNYYCGNFGVTPLSYISLMQNPIDDILEVTNLIYLTTQTLISFQVDGNSAIYSTTFTDQNIPSSGLILDYSASSAFTTDNIKGFQITQSTQGIIKGINLNGHLPTFSCSLYLDSLQFQTSVLSYTAMASKQTEYFLVPFGTQVKIRICLDTVCKDTEYSMLKMNESNQLYIIARVRSMFSVDFTYLEFEVVCNYSRETIKYLFPYTAILSTPVDMNIATQTYPAGEFQIFMDKITLDQGNGSYYFDYDSQNENCFLFKDITTMKCDYPKQGYVLYGNTLISEDECLSMSQSTNKIHIINSSKECILVDIDSSLCSEVDVSSHPISCKTCIGKNALVSDSCNCLDGTYLDTTHLMCISCDINCLTCTTTPHNCTACKSPSDQLPPLCNCISYSQYLDTNGMCKNCSDSCSTCMYDSDTCLSCADKRTNPPFCDCDYQFYQEINAICQDIICDSKCDLCQYTLNNCTSCKSGRSNPPECLCDFNSYEIQDGTCQFCPSSYFYNSKTSSCQPCLKPCKECAITQDNCISCDDGLNLEQQSCFCQSGLPAVYLYTGQLTCPTEMQVSLKVVKNQSYYQLEFTFDYYIISIDFTNTPLSKLMTLTLAEIPINYYQLVNPIIDGSKLITKLQINSNIQTQFGSVIFLQNSAFVSSNQQYVLSTKYKIEPIQFNIGPYLFSQSVLDQQDIGAVISNLKNQNESFKNVVQQSQFLFYLINTAQPTLLFLLLNAQHPPNLYAFYQILGIMVFPDVVDYQTEDYKNKFSILGVPLKDYEITLSDNKIYKKLGLTNSFLVNAPVVIIKYFLLAFIIISIKLAINYIIISRKLYKKLTQINYFLIKQFNSENETNLLLITLSILVQFTDTNGYQWPVRYGYYLSIIFIVVFVISFYQNIIELNSNKRNSQFEYSTMFTERLKNNRNFFARNYFPIQILKKYSVILVLFAFQDLPYFACFINGFIFLASGFQTLLCRPYKHFLSRIIKVVGDILLSTAWFLHIIILNIESQLFKQTIINDDKINIYLNTGLIIIIVLLVFNIIFLIEYVQTLFFLIKAACKKKIDQELVTYIIPKRNKAKTQAQSLEMCDETVIKEYVSSNQVKKEKSKQCNSSINHKIS